MGNKTKLQQHNATLRDEVLTAIQNLPGGGYPTQGITL